MIFVTVGTHEQPFDRLVRAVDGLVADGTLDEPVFVRRATAHTSRSTASGSASCQLQR